MNNKLEGLIAILKSIQDGGEPKVPYHLHDGIKAIISSLGTHDAIEFFEKLLKADI